MPQRILNGVAPRPPHLDHHTANHFPDGRESPVTTTTMSEQPAETTDNESDAPTPTKAGEPQAIDTVEEACYNCGVVQQMTVKQQRYENSPMAQYISGECPVCGNDHAANPPW